jgi:hypothetical protein
MINAGLGREDHNLIPTIMNERKLKPLDAKIDAQTRLSVLVDRILLYKTPQRKRVITVNNLKNVAFLINSIKIQI